MANTSILAAFERMWQHITSALSNKSDISHNHNDIYYTELEINNKLSDINTSVANIYETKTDANSKLTEAKGYTDSKVADLASITVVDNKISAHNIATDVHNDIRLLISDLTTKLNNFLDVDDTTVDQLSEVLTLINNNKGTLESLTTSKVNVSDIIDNLTTNSSDKVLSAAQGVAIKSLIDALETEVNTKAASSDLTSHTNNKSNPHEVTAEQTGALPLTGGTMEGALVLTGGDAISGVGNMQLDTNGQITAKGTTSTLFGRNSATNLLVGHSSHSLTMRGSGSRPTYNGNNVALQSDIEAAIGTAIGGSY